MQKIEVYSMGYCPYCKAAKRLLKALNWTFTEYEITGRPRKRDEMIRRTGRQTVPQIFINSQHIGGFDDFSAYVQDKELI